MADSKTFLHKSRNNGWSVVVEDNGRTGYAYLLDSDDKIRADVWLYNRGPAPKKPEWDDKDKAPYANPVAYVAHELPYDLPRSEKDVSVKWESGKAKIFIGGKVAGVLAEGSKPGWSALAAKDGPLAKVLREG